MNLKSDSVIGIIGAGTMGSGIAQVAATAGHKALLFDADAAVVKRAANNLKDIFSKLVLKGKLTEEQSKEIQSRIIYPSALSEFKECSLVIEAVVENAEVK